MNSHLLGAANFSGFKPLKNSIQEQHPRRKRDVDRVRRWNKHRSVLGGLVDAELSRRWLKRLQRAGVSLEASAHASGLNLRCLRRVEDGSAKRIQAATQAAIMALTPEQINEERRVTAAEATGKAIAEFANAGVSLTCLAEVLETDTRWLNNLLEGKQHQVSVQQNKTGQKLTWLDLKLPVGAPRRQQP